MEKLKKGDKLKIYCYKNDGSLEHISDSVVVLEDNDECLICGNGKTKITEKDGRSHMTGEPAVLFFYKNSWFNVIGQLKKFGLYYYCNIASPYIIEDNIIKYIDYDLDLRVFPDGGFRILDRNEYNYHRKIMNYSDRLDKVIKSQLSKLIEIKRNNSGPFETGIVEKYYDEYRKLSKNSKKS